MINKSIQNLNRKKKLAKLAAIRDEKNFKTNLKFCVFLQKKSLCKHVAWRLRLLQKKIFYLQQNI